MANEDEDKKEKDLDKDEQSTAQEDDTQKDGEEQKDEEQQDEQQDEKKGEQPPAEDSSSQEVADLRNQVKALEDRCQKAEAALARLTAGLGNSGKSAPAPKTFAEMVNGIKATTQAEWDDQFLTLKKDHPAAFQSWMVRK